MGNVVDFAAYRRYRLCSKREREIIDWLQRDGERQLTREEINLSLEQAKAILGEDFWG